jgi:hypothetical protein
MTIKEVLHTLQDLRTPKHPTPVPVSITKAAVLTDEILCKVLTALPPRSAAGPRTWNYEHMKAATSSSEDAHIAVLHLDRAIVEGNLFPLPVAKPSCSI